MLSGTQGRLTCDMDDFIVPDLELEVALSGIGEGRRGLSLALTLPLFFALLAAICLVRLERRATRSSVATTGRSVAVLLDVQTPGLVPPPPAPAATPSPIPGDPMGTGTVDPDLLKYAQLRPDLPQATSFTPDLTLEAPRGLPETATTALVPPGMPLGAGGNGMARGSGTGAARIQAKPGLRQLAPEEVDDLRVTKQVIPVIKNAKRGLGGYVMVRVYLGADGVPQSALPLSGPETTFPQIIAAVLQWRFHVPDRMKAQCPIRLEVRMQLSY